MRWFRLATTSSFTCLIITAIAVPTFMQNVPVMIASATNPSNNLEEESYIDNVVNSPRTGSIIIAQEGKPGREKLSNPDWQIVPGADVGKNPALKK